MKRLANLARLSFFPRLGLFIGVLVLLWLPWALLVSGLVTDDPNQLTIWAMGGLFVVFLGWLWVWGHQVQGIPHPFRYYGLGWRRRNGLEALLGLCLSLSFLALLYGVQGWLGWLEWAPLPENFAALFWQGGLTALGVGLAEELLFRGWLLNEMERDFAKPKAAAWSAIAFALLHFLKPLNEVLRLFPQFAGLILLGLILARAKQRSGQLGLPIGLHGGLVWGYYLVDVGDWVVYGDRVPQWLTGIHENPLAGLMGLMFLFVLLLLINYLPVFKWAKEGYQRSSHGSS